jgi:hypothetical protein
MLIQAPSSLVSPIDPRVSRVPSGGAAGRKLPIFHTQSTPFHTFFHSFYLKQHNTLCMSIQEKVIISISWKNEILRRTK